ncbi:MAG: CCA tRNA nucleotidyltransferase [Phycisphaerae bacterium]
MAHHKTQGKQNPQRSATETVKILQDAGFEAFFAGGCVRDQIMGNSPEDYDIATSARPEKVLQLFPRSARVGAAFGVVMVRLHGRSMEVATFRSDGVYSDGRRPDSVAFTTAEHDAQRRDFTCNGLFFDPVANDLIDYVNGQADIRAKILRAIGDPAQRFREDHLRMMRAIRFAARLGFTIEPATWAAICDNAERLSDISRERIGQELRKILLHPQRQVGAQWLILSGLLNSFWPLHHVANSPTIALPRLSALPKTISFPAALAALMIDLDNSARHDPTIISNQIASLQTSLALSGMETQCATWLLMNLPVLENWHNARLASLKRLLAHAWSDDLLMLYAAEHAADEKAALLAKRIAELKTQPLAPDRLVNGDDLIAMGAQPGPLFKEWLEELYDRQLENEFPDRPSALQAAKSLLLRT